MDLHMPLAEAMRTQRSIRRLKPDPVDDTLIMKLLELALKAPSGGNRQNAEFVVVRDPAVKRGLGRLNRVAWGMYGRILEVLRQERREDPPRHEGGRLGSRSLRRYPRPHRGVPPVDGVRPHRERMASTLSPVSRGHLLRLHLSSSAKSAAWSPSGGPRCFADGHASVERLARTSRSRPAVVGLSGGRARGRAAGRRTARVGPGEAAAGWRTLQ